MHALDLLETLSTGYFLDLRDPASRLGFLPLESHFLQPAPPTVMGKATSVRRPQRSLHLSAFSSFLQRGSLSKFPDLGVCCHCTEFQNLCLLSAREARTLTLVELRLPDHKPFCPLVLKSQTRAVILFMTEGQLFSSLRY